MSRPEQAAGRLLPASSVTLFGLAELLWPSPASITTSRGGDRTVAQYLPVPSTADPRLLLPARPWRAAAAAVRHQPAASTKARVRRELAALGLAAGLGELVPRHRIRVHADHPVETIEVFFARHWDRPIVLSIHLGKPRANRKPVVGILSPAGAALGFAKIGVNELTRSLVRTEANALAVVARANPRQLTAARVLLQERWNTLDVVATSLLPVWEGRRPVPVESLRRATQEVHGLVPTGELTVSDWLAASGLRDRLAGLPESPASAGVRGAVGTLVDRAGGVRLACGAWHGDWTPWNMAFVGGRLLVWDWERFSAPAPVGFDALHHRLQGALVSQRRPPRQAVRELGGQAYQLLAPYDVGPAVVPVMVVAYLVELAGRYLHDGQEAAGARLGRVGDWLVPMLAQLAGRL